MGSRLNPQMEIAAVGDIQLESWFCMDALPEAGATHVAPGEPLRPGGSPFHVARHLGHLGCNVTIYGGIARGLKELVTQPLLRAHVKTELFCVDTWQFNHLVLLNVGGTTYSFFSPMEDVAEIEDVLEPSSRADVLLVGGSRTTSLRRHLLRLTEAFTGSLIVFSPNYAIYEYTPSEVRQFLDRADVVALNTQESQFAQEHCGTTLESLVGWDKRKIMLIMKEDRGAEILLTSPRLQGSSKYRIRSLSGTEGNVVGSGDAFLGTFLAHYLRTSDALESAEYGAGGAAKHIGQVNSIEKSHLSWDSIKGILREQRGLEPLTTKIL